MWNTFHQNNSFFLLVWICIYSWHLIPSYCMKLSWLFIGIYTAGAYIGQHKSRLFIMHWPFASSYPIVDDVCQRNTEEQGKLLYDLGRDVTRGSWLISFDFLKVGSNLMRFDFGNWCLWKFRYFYVILLHRFILVAYCWEAISNGFCLLLVSHVADFVHLQLFRPCLVI